MKSTREKDCAICTAISGAKRLNETPRVMVTKHWIVEHCYPAAIKGWMVLMPKRHVTAAHELSKEELIEFAEILHAVCAGQHELYGTANEYIIQLSEAEGYYHINFHVIPRLPDLPEEIKGRRVFNAMGNDAENLLSVKDTATESMRMQNYLLKHLPTRLLK